MFRIESEIRFYESELEKLLCLAIIFAALLLRSLLIKLEVAEKNSSFYASADADFTCAACYETVSKIL